MTVTLPQACLWWTQALRRTLGRQASYPYRPRCSGFPPVRTSTLFLLPLAQRSSWPTASGGYRLFGVCCLSVCLAATHPFLLRHSNHQDHVEVKSVAQSEQGAHVGRTRVFPPSRSLTLQTVDLLGTDAPTPTPSHTPESSQLCQYRFCPGKKDADFRAAGGLLTIQWTLCSFLDRAKARQSVPDSGAKPARIGGRALDLTHRVSRRK